MSNRNDSRPGTRNNVRDTFRGAKEIEIEARKPRSDQKENSRDDDGRHGNSHVPLTKRQKEVQSKMSDIELLWLPEG